MRALLHWRSYKYKFLHLLHIVLRTYPARCIIINLPFVETTRILQRVRIRNICGRGLWMWGWCVRHCTNYIRYCGMNGLSSHWRLLRTVQHSWGDQFKIYPVTCHEVNEESYKKRKETELKAGQLMSRRRLERNTSWIEESFALLLRLCSECILEMVWSCQELIGNLIDICI